MADMQRPRKRNTSPTLQPLEPRQLLDGAALAGTWVGQDGHDLVGPSAQIGPSDVQDVRIGLTGLPADRTVVAAVVQGNGGGTWTTRAGSGAWAAAFVRSGDAAGDVYFEPYQVETGRPFGVTLTYDDGTTASAFVAGGAADPQRRMPAAALRADWGGQGPRDLVGTAAAVGPDGVRDVVLSLANLSTRVPIEMIRVDGPPGLSWSYGPDRQARAEARLIPDPADPSKAQLLLSPDRDLDGQELSVLIVYATGATDAAVVLAGPTDPRLAPAEVATLPAIRPGASATWAGQDGTDLTGPGDVRLAVAGVPAGRSVVAAVLTNAAGRAWVYRGAGAPAGLHVDPFPQPMALRVEAGGALSLAFPPVRDESGTVLALRLVYDDGTIGLASVAGGAADPGRRAASPSASSVVARPGDDLQALVLAHGTVRLSAGVYDLSRPLVLDRPVDLLGDPGAVLRFAQPADAAPWTAAIKVHESNTTLDGFAVRFAGPVRWDRDVPYGPAVIGTTDERDNRFNALKVDLTFTRLDLEAPPAADPDGWEAAPGLIRLMTAESGRIAGNTLHGGTIEFDHGPWTITGNTYTGTPAGTFTDAVFSGHETSGLEVAGNRAESRAGSGKTWRFLVLTVSGDGDAIRDNTVVGIGPRDDDDTIPQANATEIVLTEAYRVRFEGRPSRVSDDGRIVQLGEVPGGTPEAGEVVAVLEGPAAGTWRRVAQVLDPRTILLDAPLPLAARGVALSVGAGFVGLDVERNTIDARGSSLAANLVLVGAQFGTTVADNALYGGRYALKVASTPTETPVIWGWTHTAAFGITLDDNLIVDTREGAVIDLEAGPAIRASKGRVYFTGSVTDTTFGWSAAFRAGAPSPTAMTIGNPHAPDPTQLVVALAGTRSGGGASTVVVAGALVNGELAVDQSRRVAAIVPGAPGGLALVSDTGRRADDDLTRDGRLRFDAAADASWYEAKVGDGPWVRLAGAGTFLPAGLAQGANRVAVRAVDAWGTRGPESAATLRLDTVAPGDVRPFAVTAGRQVRFQPTDSGDTYEYRVGAAGPWVALGQNIVFTPAGLRTGPNEVTVRATDAAGNVGPGATTVVTLPRPLLSGRWVGHDGTDLVGRGSALAPDGFQDVRIGLAGVVFDQAIAEVTVTGLGGGVWSTRGAGGTWRAAVVRTPGLATAEVAIQAYQRETGRSFRVEVRYEDGTTAAAWVQGGTAFSNLRVGQAPPGGVRVLPPALPQPAGRTVVVGPKARAAQARVQAWLARRG
jgi:hypothetical protein